MSEVEEREISEETIAAIMQSSEPYDAELDPMAGTFRNINRSINDLSLLIAERNEGAYSWDRVLGRLLTMYVNIHFFGLLLYTKYLRGI